MFVHVCVQPGKEMVAAGYCMYGSNCCMVMSVGSGTSVFTLDPSIGEFVLTSSNIHIPATGSIYSINEGNDSFWFAEVSRYPPRVLHHCSAVEFLPHNSSKYANAAFFQATDAS